MDEPYGLTRLTLHRHFLVLAAVLCLLTFHPGPILASGGITPPSPTDEGRALLKSRAYNLAMERFREVEEKSGNYIERAQALRLIGETQFHEKDYASAYQAYQQSLRLNPLTTGVLGLEFRSAVALVYLKSYTSAVSKFQALEKRATEPDTFSDLYFWEAECYFQMGRYEEAGKQYQKILEENPHYRWADLIQYLKAWCFYQQKDYEKALSLFQDVLAGAKNETLQRLALFQVAETLFRLQRYSDALSRYQEFSKKYPEDLLKVPSLYGQGWCQEKLAHHPEAAYLFEKIVTDYPTHALAPWAAVREGVEEDAEGNREEARKVFQKGLFGRGQVPRRPFTVRLGLAGLFGPQIRRGLPFHGRDPPYTPKRP